MLSRTVLSLAATLALAACQTVATKQQAATNDPAAHCAAFADMTLPGTTVRETEAVTERADLPPFCAIRGTIAPQIGFEARFPLEGWNGKYYQSGCGGYCGRVLPDKSGFSNTINEALKRGYAAITTDGGHSAPHMGDASWAPGNRTALEVYAHLDIRLTYDAGLRMVTAFYGRAPDLEYFGGCSNGGRMAAMAAQRYPDLFDGILGGGGVLNLSGSGGIYGSWVVQVNTGPDGRRLLTRASLAPRLPVLQTFVIEQCDATDGKSDGIISSPRKCRVDVSGLPACELGEAGTCFTAVEREVLQKWYDGPRDSAGRSLFPGMPPGSEQYWLVWFLDGADRTAPGNALGGDYARYMGFADGAPEDFTAMDFDFDRDPARLAANGALLDALDPDLSDFRAAGGKFLMWHGWQDPLVLPDQSVAYYRDLLATMGGRERVDPFFRLFMIPGMGHCWEMPSTLPDRFNPIAVLEDWVEQGQAPAKLDVRPLDGNKSVVPATVVCPYPVAPLFLDSEAELAIAQCEPLGSE